MKVLRRTLGALVLCFGLIPFQAEGHEFILKPAATHVSSGKAAQGQVQAAHVFMESEEAEPMSDVVLSLSGPFAKTEVAVSGKKDQHWLDYTFMSPTPESFVLNGWRKPQIWSATTDGILEGDRAALEKQGKTVVSVGKYEKFTKTFYNLSEKADIFTQAQGHRLEIVPVTDAETMHQKKHCSFRVLLDGQPIAVPVNATYDGFSDKEDTYKLTVQPKADKTVDIPLDHKGLWLMRAETTLQKPEPGIDTLNLRATLVMDVR